LDHQEVIDLTLTLLNFQKDLKYDSLNMK